MFYHLYVGKYKHCLRLTSAVCVSTMAWTLNMYDYQVDIGQTLN